MTLVLAGLFGLGGPEIAVLLVLMTVVAVPVGIVLLIVKVVRPNRITRFCPKCGRGLAQEAAAPFCSYCGNRLP
jgi:hypothetical protein